MLKVFLYVILFMMTFCTKKPFVIQNDDPITIDINLELKNLKADLFEINSDNEKVRLAFADTNITQKFGPALKKEYFANQEHIKNIEQEINILEIRGVKRYSVLSERIADYGDNFDKILIKSEVNTYFQDKKINPIKKTWKNRFKAAASLKK